MLCRDQYCLEDGWKQMGFVYKCESITKISHGFLQVKMRICEGFTKTIKWIGNHLNTAPKEDGLITLALIFRNVFTHGFYTWPCEIKQNVYPVFVHYKMWEVDYKMDIKTNTQRDVDRE